ncbi:MAG: DUF1761 domain-containing protein [Sphingobacteriales bacterium]|nr:MAG: DUF1761 domain-containing protein [Sphingobacteriales bacterium]
MDQLNFMYLFLTALIPLITGFIWYSKPLFAKSWMRSAGLTEENLKQGKMALIFLLTYVLGLFISFGLMPIVIHQAGIYGVLANEPGLNDPNSEISKYVADFMSKHGRNFRTFRHGALHGTMTGLFLALPITGIVAMFERRSFKYVAIHTGYWILTLALMGGVICAFL